MQIRLTKIGKLNLSTSDCNILIIFAPQSVENPDLLYQELTSDNELDKSIHDGGNLKYFWAISERSVFDASIFICSSIQSMLKIKFILR